MVDYDSLSIHEAGHTVAAHAFGRPVGTVGIRGRAGRSFHTPPRLPDEIVTGADVELAFSLWPMQMRGRFEGDVCIFMAGAVAEELLIPVLGRVPETIAARALALVPQPPDVTVGDLAPMSEADHRELDYSLDHDTGSDEQEIARIALLAHGPDVASAATWLGYLRCQTAAIVLAGERQIRRLALVLDSAGSMSGQAVAAFLTEGDTRDAHQ
jgi:hypothetical protein